MIKMTIDEMVRKALEMRASDIHVVAGLPLRVRVDGKLIDMDINVVTAEECEQIGRELAGKDYEKIQEKGEIDLAATLAGGIRCRLNIYRQQKTISVSLRLLNNKKAIPTPEELFLPEIVSTFSTFKNGIVLVTGETGSGKSTTLASLLDSINHSSYKHIITLEDPIEYVYQSDKCTVTQRSIGVDTESYANALRGALREDPDVILIGEMRDYTTMETALTAAETGHLVFATLHTNSAVGAIERIIGVFPADKQPQIRLQLSMTLRAVLSQQLLLRKSGVGRIVACEVMIVNTAIRSLIREGRTPQIQNAIVTSANEGNITMDNMLQKMVRLGSIDVSVAYNAAHDQESFAKAVGYVPNKTANPSADKPIMGTSMSSGMRRPLK